MCMLLEWATGLRKWNLVLVNLLEANGVILVKSLLYHGNIL